MILAEISSIHLIYHYNPKRVILEIQTLRSNRRKKQERMMFGEQIRVFYGLDLRSLLMVVLIIQHCLIFKI